MDVIMTVRDTLPQLQAASANEAGLDAGRLREAERLIEGAIQTGIFPGAAALVARSGTVGWHRAFGHAQVVPRLRIMNPDTIFDLASLTKVIGTVPVALRLCKEGAFNLDTPVSAILQEFARDRREQVTIRHLLAHTSGLPSWEALYLRARSRQHVLREICRTPLQNAPGTAVEYSDLGILLLGFAMEKVTDRRLDRLVREVVTEPLRLMQTGFTPPQELWECCAATEAGHRYERTKVEAEGRNFPWREDVLCGEVHDGNAYYAMEGVAGHAGLFSTAWEVATVAFQWIRPGLFLSSDLVEEATRDQRQGAEGDPRGFGWILHHEGTFFEALGPRSFGHTGFTGTSVAVDPDPDLVVVLLTNSVHPQADDTRIIEFRLRFHKTVRKALT